MISRGEVWTVAGGGYSGKPRPAVVIQGDAFRARQSATVCLMTTVPEPFPLFRITIEPSPANGLKATTFCMVDKITTVRFDQLRSRIGRLAVADMANVDQAVLTYLDLARR